MTNSKQDALAVWQAFGSRDPQKIRAILTEDAQWIAPAGNATQVALGLPTEMLETREGIIAFLTEHFRKLFPDGAKFEFTAVVAEGPLVVFEQRMRATTMNGRDYDNLYCWVFEMDGPRVRRIREYMDTLAGQRMIFGNEAARAIVS